MSIRLGLIGVGRIGSLHLNNLVRRVEEAVVTAVADPNLERARALADSYGIAAVYPDYGALLEDSHVDAVIVAAPASDREPMLLAALEARRPIFCEKPVAMDLETHGRIEQAAARFGVPVQVGFMRRFDSGYRAARDEIRKGTIGQPVSIRCVTRDRQLPPLEAIVRSGDLFVDLLIHDFDLCRYLMEDEVAQVYATGGVYVYDELRAYGDLDSGLAALRFRNGAFGSVEGSRHGSFGYDIRTEIQGSRGNLQVGLLRHTPMLRLTSEGATFDLVPGFLERFGDAYAAEMEAFCRVVASGQKPEVSLTDSRRALEIALAAQRSLVTGASVALSESAPG